MPTNEINIECAPGYICLHQKFEKVIDELSSILMEKGFDEKSEPNSFGISIEVLIDKFSEAIYE